MDTKNIYLKYFIRLLKHKYYVFIAGKKTGVPLWLRIIHDWTKFSPIEFLNYARNNMGHYSSRNPMDEEEKASRLLYAWLNHENTNKHHWGYWIPRSGANADAPLDIPEIYVREMIADWMAAAKSRGLNWNFVLYINNRGIKMRFHNETLKTIDDVMNEIGFSNTDNCMWSYMPFDKFFEWVNSHKL